MTDSKQVDESHLSKFDAGTAYMKCLDYLRDGMFKEYSLTIIKYHPAGSLEKAGGGRIDKPCLEFKEARKILILSITNQESLHLITGTDDPNKIMGVKITLAVRFVKFGKQDILGLRIMPPVGTRMTKGLIGRLGSPAVWVGAAKNPSDAKDTDEDAKDSTPQAQ